MKRALIHIGTGKTGTTSIQAGLGGARPERFGVGYPRPEPFAATPNQNFLAVVYRTFERLPRGYASMFEGDRAAFEDCRTRLRASWEQALAGNDKLVVSGEFLGNFSARAIEAFKADLDSHGFEDVTIVVYVREPASFYLSLAQQLVKASHELRPLKDFVYRFRKTIRDWNRLFPKVRVFSYDQHKEEERGVIGSFEGLLDDAIGVSFRLESEGRANTSMGLNGFQTLIRYRKKFYPDEPNRFRPDSDRLLRTILSVEEPDERLRLSDAARDYISYSHREDIEWLSSNYGVSLGPIWQGTEPVAPTEIADIIDGYGEISPDFNTALIRHLLHSEGKKSYFKELARFIRRPSQSGR